MSAVRCLSAAEIEAAATVLRGGHVLGLPTETVYGLAADATNEQAVARVYAAKGRPLDHPVIVHLARLEQVALWAKGIPDYAVALAKAFWPGPMTLVLPKTEKAGSFVTGGQDTVALRIPNHPVALAVLREFGDGVCAPSANRFGSVSPTTAGEVVAELGQWLSADDAVIDGGRCEVGVESTIIDCTGDRPRILRPGGITAAQVEEVTRLSLETGETAVRAPGTLASHYSPRAEVWLASEESQLAELARSFPGAGFIALDSTVTPEGLQRLASPQDAQEYARNLYSALRSADELGLAAVIALPPTGVDIALAVRDRLVRAAHK